MGASSAVGKAGCSLCLCYRGLHTIGYAAEQHWARACWRLRARQHPGDTSEGLHDVTDGAAEVAELLDGELDGPLRRGAEAIVNGCSSTPSGVEPMRIQANWPGRNR